MRIITVFFLSVFSSGVLVAEVEPFPIPRHPNDVRELFPEISPDQQEALRFINNFAPYSPERFDGLTYNDLYVVAGSRAVAEACFSLLEDARFSNYWSDVFHAVGKMASVDPGRVDYKRLTDAVRRVEASDLPERVVMRTLPMAYIAVGRFGSEKSEAFLVPRMTKAFWKKRRKLEQNWAPAGSPPSVVTPRYFAILQLNVLGDDAGLERLKSLVSEGLIEKDEIGENAVDSAKRRAQSRRNAHERNIELYRKWKEENSDSDRGSVMPSEEDSSIEGQEDDMSHEGADETESGTSEKEAPRRLDGGGMLGSGRC